MWYLSGYLWHGMAPLLSFQESRGPSIAVEASAEFAANAESEEIFKVVSREMNFIGICSNKADVFISVHISVYVWVPVANTMANTFVN